MKKKHFISVILVLLLCALWAFPAQAAEQSAVSQARNGVVRILAVQPHEALLLMEEVSYTKLAKPVMYSLSYYTAFFDFALLRKKF